MARLATWEMSWQLDKMPYLRDDQKYEILFAVPKTASSG